MNIEQVTEKLWATLKKYNVATAEVEYSGSGDSGGTEYPTFYDASGEEVHIPDSEVIQLNVNHSEWEEEKNAWISRIGPKNHTVSECLDSLAWDILEKEFSGWEIDSGSQGRLIVDCINYIVRLEHEENIMRQEAHEREWSVRPQPIHELAIEMSSDK